VFPRGTLLMAMYGQGVTRGKVAFLGIAAATNQACAAFFPDRAKLQPEFLYAFCTFAYHRIRELGHGANQKNLSGEILRGMPIPVPRDLAEQQSVYDLLATIERRIEAAVRRNKGLQALFSSALNQLMTGQLRVTPLLEEKEDGNA
jgi:type I restriction enzyme S subunit